MKVEAPSVFVSFLGRHTLTHMWVDLFPWHFVSGFSRWLYRRNNKYVIYHLPVMCSTALLHITICIALPLFSRPYSPQKKRAGSFFLASSSVIKPQHYTLYYPLWDGWGCAALVLLLLFLFSQFFFPAADIDAHFTQCISFISFPRLLTFQTKCCRPCLPSGGCYCRCWAHAAFIPYRFPKVFRVYILPKEYYI